MMIPSYTPDKELELLEEERESISLSLNNSKQELEDIKKDIINGKNKLSSLNVSIKDTQDILQKYDDEKRRKEETLLVLNENINTSNNELFKIGDKIIEAKKSLDEINGNCLFKTKELQSEYEKEKEINNKELSLILNSLKEKNKELDECKQLLKESNDTVLSLDEAIKEKKLELDNLNSIIKESKDVYLKYELKKSELEKIEKDTVLAGQKLEQTKLLIKEQLRYGKS